MFFASTANKEKIAATDYVPGTPVICPGCGAPVFVKKGPKVMAHFAHYANADCRQFSEGETPQHLLGKQRLYDWLHAQKIPVEMEAWLPELQQRPDLLIRYQNRKIALEYQCSPLPFARLKERTDGYLQNGYEVYWLCGMAYTPVTYTEAIAAFRQSNNTVICFDSGENKLHMHYYLHFDTRNKLTKETYSVALSKLTFPAFETLFKKDQPIRRYPTQPLAYRQQLQLLQKKDPLHRDFLLRVYLAGHAVQNLPACIFSLPHKTLAFRQPSYLWKYDFFHHLDERLTSDQIYAFARTVPQYNTLYPQHCLSTIQGFVAELESEGVIRRVDEKKWHVQSFLLLKK